MKQHKKVKGPVKPKGKSKYAKKVAARRRLAEKLGLPASTTYPILRLPEPEEGGE
jgi:hypothetical protein